MAIAFVTALLLCGIGMPGSSRAEAQPASGFTFTAVGDYGNSSGTTATLDAIAAAQPALHLGLGDFNYDPDVSDTDWCAYVREHIPPAVPIEIVAGNREDLSGDQEDGDAATSGAPPSGEPSLGTYTACLPDGLGNVVGEYGREYFFDYPAQQPLARFIMLSPQLTFADGTREFRASGPHTAWATWAIDDARAHQIPWVIVGAHKPCLTMGVQNCASGRDFLNLLVSRGVDLVLQGHDHTYQRTKQLGLNPPACEALTRTSYNPACVADADLNTYTKGHGSVFAIVGTGGAPRTPIQPAAPDASYFASGMGSNGADTSGFLEVSLTSTELHATFQPAVAGSFSDQFTIRAPAALSTGSAS